MAIKTGRELAGLAVLTLTGGERLGRVEDVIFQLSTGQITGFIVTMSGLLTRAKLLPISAVNSLGPDALTVSSSEALCDQPKEGTAPTEFSVKSVAGRPVINEAGTAQGTVDDAIVNTESLMVVAMALATGVISDMLHGKPQLPLSLIKIIGPQSVIISDSYDPKSTEKHT